MKRSVVPVPGIALRFAVLSVFVVACTGSDVLLYRVESDGSGGVSGALDGLGGTAARPAGGSGATPTPIAGNGGASGGSGRGASGGGTSSGGRAGSGTSGAGGAGGVKTPPDSDAGSSADAGGANTGGIAGFTPCTTTADCAAGWMCQKLDCSAPNGICEPRPILCDQNPVPFCGCDGVTYWNDCLRQQNGVESSTAGQCTLTARVCNVATDCNATGSSCAHVIPTASPCGMTGPGTCWIIPSDCSSVPPTIEWMPCQLMPFGNVPPGTTFPCVDTCTAIRSGQPYVGVPSPTMCK